MNAGCHLCHPGGEPVLSITQYSSRPRARAHISRAVIVALVLSLLSAVVVATPARAAQIVGLEATTTSPVLAGEDTSMSFTASNDTADPWYNLAFTALLPAGVAPAAGGWILGAAPVAYTNADDPTIPVGFTLYVWEDLVDLPAGADFTAEVPLAIAQPPIDDSGSATTTDPAVHPAGRPSRSMSRRTSARTRVCCRGSRAAPRSIRRRRRRLPTRVPRGRRRPT